MPFADLHIHPTLKTQFSDAADKFQPDEKVREDEVLTDFVRLCSDMGDVIQSQANIRQLVDNKVKIVCLALYSPEPEIIGNRSLMQAVRNHPAARRYISQSRLEAFRDGVIKPFEFAHDYELATALSLNYSDLGKIIPLKKSTVIDDNAAKNVYAVFSIEGCHSLLNSFDDFKHMNTVAAVITTNLQTLLDEKIPVISVNLTHLVDYPLCNHAFGMQFFFNQAFFPKRNGLTQAAKDIANWCFDHRIHIDVKHMSIKSRMDLYKLRRTNGTPLPIICSHAGFAGISWKQYPAYINLLEDAAPDYYRLEMCKPRGYFDKTSFNANTINLYDEDIEEILRTRGIIGLSMDKRIVGYTDPAVTTYAPQDRPEQLLEEDYFSYHEFHDAELYANLDGYGGKTTNNDCLFVEEIDDMSTTGLTYLDNHFRHLVNHFVHLYMVAKKKFNQIGMDPLEAVTNYLCIGSDFDGLINPVICSTSVEDLDELKVLFEQKFRTAFNEATGAAITNNQAQKIIDNFFYNNAKEFIVQWLNS